jgi:multidrug resistance protein
LGFGIIIPILPYYAKTFGASGTTLGWLMTAYSLMQFLVAPIWGSLSDRFGRRPILLMSILGSCISLTMLGFAQSLIWLFIARLLAGLFGANISTAYAYIADSTDEQNRAKGMGIIGASFGLGFILGPAIGGVLSQWGYSTPMFFGAGLAVINLITAYFHLPEPVVTAEIRAQNRSRRFNLAVIKNTFAIEGLKYPILTFFVMTLAITQMEVVFGFYLKERFDYDAQAAGVLLALSGIIMAAIQGGGIGRLSKKFSDHSLIFCGSLFCSIGLLVFGISPVIIGVVIGLTIMSIGHGVMHPTLSSLTSKRSPKSSQGATMGVFHSMSSLARVIGPPIAGFLYDHAGQQVPFMVAGGLVAGITVTTIIITNNNKPSH